MSIIICINSKRVYTYEGIYDFSKMVCSSRQRYHLPKIFMKILGIDEAVFAAENHEALLFA